MIKLFYAVVCGGMLINGAFLSSCMLVGLRFCFFGFRFNILCVSLGHFVLYSFFVVLGLFSLAAPQEICLRTCEVTFVSTHIHTHNHLMALCLELPRWADTRRNIHPLTSILIIRHSVLID